MLCAAKEKREVPDICHNICVVHALTSHPCALLTAFKPTTLNASTGSETTTSCFYSLSLALFSFVYALRAFYHPVSMHNTNLLSDIVQLPCILTSTAMPVAFDNLGLLWFSTLEDTTNDRRKKKVAHIRVEIPLTLTKLNCTSKLKSLPAA